MSRVSRKAYGIMVLLGIDPLKARNTLREMPSYLRALRSLKSQEASAERAFSFGRLYPCLHEHSSEGGQASGHYFHQDLLVARRIYQNEPERHVDVGSRIDGFVAHVATFRAIEVIDIRPTPSVVTNIEFVQADLMQPVRPELQDYCDSLSCLHALEHFGLGRYGDNVDYDGHLLGLKNLNSLLRTGGTFYLSVPIGHQRIEFNAHRVFSVEYLLERLADDYRLDHFSYVDDSGHLHEDVEVSEADARDSFGCSYGCGIFEMTKL